MGGLTVALLIFFGAWAVSSSEAGAGGALTSALTGANTNPAAAADAGPASGGANANPFQVASLDETGETAAEESWWGQAFLKACPLH